jgi:hypothetical protein
MYGNGKNGGSAAAQLPDPRFVRYGFPAAVLICAALYAALQLTPSSYTLVLHLIGVSDTGLVFGMPQEGRSDEWAIWTPYFQIAVQNGFARIEHISPYEADLRNFNCLPLWDWALIFKPQMWAFFVMPPAPAFSLMFAILFAACLIGWYLLGRAFRFPDLAAAIFAVAMFSLQYVQLWWTTTGPLIAFFPWLLLVCIVPMPAWLRVPLIVWITGTFLLSHFYMIVIGALAFAGAISIVALRPDVVRIPRIVICMIGGAIGFGLVVFYLWGPFQIMANTVYPGHRNDVPGGIMPWSWMLSYLFPHFVTAKWEPYYWNDHEIANGGSYALLFALIFVSFGRLRDVIAARTDEDRATRWALGVLGIGVLVILAWWALPIPAKWATPLFWNTSAPQRLSAAMGMLAHLMAFLLLLRVGAVPSLLRVAIVIALIAGATYYSKFVLFDANPRALKYDLLIVPLLLAGFWLSRLQLRRGVQSFGYALLLAGALSNSLVFMPFNPMQRAGPIFAKQDSPLLRDLRAKQEANPHKWLVANFVPGANAAGLGFRSIRHVTITPQVEFFRKVFPDMPADKLNFYFNRFAHIIPDANLTEPRVSNNLVVEVPEKAFE